MIVGIYITAVGRVLLRYRSAICGLFLVGMFLLVDVCSQELKIERSERTVPYFRDAEGQPRGWVKLKEDLYQARFYIQSDYLRFFVDEANPFADKPPKQGGPQQVLEKAGIKFGKGAKVEFFPQASILMVTQTREQLELVEAFLARDPPERQLTTRVEIYELPALQALELVSSAEAEGNHKPERNAVLELVKKGQARLVAMPTLTTLSGAKGKLTDDAESVIDQEISDKKNEGLNKEAVPETHYMGTVFEVDPVVGSDNWTMDLAVSLEYHTAPPVLKPVVEWKEKVQFHRKKITTQVTLYSGNYLFLRIIPMTLTMKQGWQVRERYWNRQGWNLERRERLSIMPGLQL